MTPARRRKWIRNLFLLIGIMLLGIGLRFLYINYQRLPALILNREQGNAPSGTVLDASSTNSPSTDASIPETEKSLIKLNFETLGNWKYVEGKTKIPDQIKELDGKWVEIIGLMMPINETKNMTQFIMLQSLWGCCFGQTPEANHVIVVHMEPGKTVDFYPDAIKVIGQFSVGETREDGYLISIYRLRANRVVVK